jgi:hypothetical protein
MSANKKDGASGFNPSFTFSEFQRMAEFFKGFLAENPLVKASIIAAGIGGALEGLHILWLVIRFLARF